jgi:non-homologous end joining protein Ku
MKRLAPPEIVPDERQIALGLQLLDSLVDDFNPDEYRADSRDRIEAIVDAAAQTKGRKKKAAPAPAVTGQQDALVLALEATLATQSKKPARKSTSRRKAS